MRVGFSGINSTNNNKSNTPQKQVGFARSVSEAYNRTAEEFVKTVTNPKNSTNLTLADGLMRVLRDKLIKPTIDAYKSLGKSIEEKKITPGFKAISQRAHEQWGEMLRTEGKLA